MFQPLYEPVPVVFDVIAAGRSESCIAGMCVQCRYIPKGLLHLIVLYSVDHSAVHPCFRLYRQFFWKIL